MIAKSLLLRLYFFIKKDLPKKNKSGILIKSLLRESETEAGKQKEIKKYFKKSLQERKTSGNI
ncbi:hypothetical protein, partial [Lactobacillus intestinalis]